MTTPPPLTSAPFSPIHGAMTRKPARRSKGFERYAIYWAPRASSPLARFGACWLDRPRETAAALGLDPDEAEAATRAPSRYGLHATMLAPFRLKEGFSEQELTGHLEDFARARRPREIGAMKIERIGSFLALVPTAPESPIRGLHIQCLFAFERFCGPPGEEEHLRRQSSAGETTEKLLLAQWGYAHVLHLYRFHVTLTGRLDAAAARRFSQALEPEIDRLNAEPERLDNLSLFGDPGGGRRFEMIERYRLPAGRDGA